MLKVYKNTTKGLRMLSSVICKITELTGTVSQATLSQSEDGKSLTRKHTSRHWTNVEAQKKSSTKAQNQTLDPFDTYLMKDEVEIERLVPKNTVIVQTKANREESDRETKKNGGEME